MISTNPDTETEAQRAASFKIANRHRNPTPEYTLYFTSAEEANQKIDEFYYPYTPAEWDELIEKCMDEIKNRVGYSPTWWETSMAFMNAPLWLSSAKLFILGLKTHDHVREETNRLYKEQIAAIEDSGTQNISITVIIWDNGEIYCKVGTWEKCGF